MKKRIQTFLFASFSFFSLCSADAIGKFVDPITDVCWSCLFPIHIGGKNVTKNHKELRSYKSKPICRCDGGLIGLPIAFWEPTRLVDVTRIPYKMVGLGGFQLTKSAKRKGGVFSADMGQSSALYHVHSYHFPLLALLSLLGDFLCIDDFPIDILYMSEFDITWNKEAWAWILAPETALFGTLPAQLACIPDCLISTFAKPSDKLFWCAGCQGNLYPLTGFVGHHSGGIRSSSLVLHRLLAKMHRVGLLKTFPGNNYCNRKRSFFINKSAYKTQLVYPKTQAKAPCNALGKSTAKWGSLKSFPYKGEDFCYLVWTKKHCCFDPFWIAKKTVEAIATAGSSLVIRTGVAETKSLKWEADEK